MDTPMPPPRTSPHLPPEQLAFLPPGEDEGTPAPKRAAAAVADALRGRRYKRDFEPSQPMLLPPSRQIYRSEHADAVDRHRTRMAASPEAMRQRAALCKHPFGTMKHWLGWDHLLVRGFEKVRGETALLVHCYNFRRLPSLSAVEGFIALCRANRGSGRLRGWSRRAFLGGPRGAQAPP
jgi:hypothetical protein